MRVKAERILDIVGDANFAIRPPRDKIRTIRKPWLPGCPLPTSSAVVRDRAARPGREADACGEERV